MAKREAKAKWKDNLKEGKGMLSLGSGAFEGEYSFKSRFEDSEGTNPEELIGAAEAACYSMALAHNLEKEGFESNEIETNAEVELKKKDDQFEISRISLRCHADIKDIDQEKFQELARKTKETCVVSRALTGTEIDIEASLK